MKRIAVISTFLAAATLLIGCRIHTKTELSHVADKSTASVETTEAVDKKLDFTITEAPIQSDFFRIEKCVFTHYARDDLIDINIEYPQIICADQESMNDINREIYDEVITNDITDWQATRIRIEISYQILFFNDDLLSVLFSGYIAPAGRYNAYEHAITFDLYTKNTLTLNDFVSTDELRKC